MSQLELPDDFRDVLVALADEQADFVLIGGWAMAVHGRPRATEGLDVLVTGVGSRSRSPGSRRGRCSEDIPCVVPAA
jgi:hypothetical protein